MKVIKIIISTLGLFYCSITLASVHSRNLNVTIVNNSHDDYLFLDADAEKNNLQHIVDYPKPAKALSTTINAFSAQRSIVEYAGLAPEGNFRYENQHDGSTCSFRFNSLGVTLLSNNNHCSVINEKPLASLLGIPYQWNAIVTISDSSYM